MKLLTTSTIMKLLTKRQHLVMVCEDGAAAAFSPVAHLFLPFTTECSHSDPFRVEDCWRALHQSKTLGWVATTCQDHSPSTWTTCSTTWE